MTGNIASSIANEVVVATGTNTADIANLQTKESTDNIAATAAGDAADAGAKTPEDTDVRADPRDKIIEQQTSTIDTLLQRTEQLTKQINSLLAMGAQINDGKADTGEQTQAPSPIEDEEYVPLRNLGAEIGKKDR